MVNFVLFSSCVFLLWVGVSCVGSSSFSFSEIESCARETALKQSVDDGEALLCQIRKIHPDLNIVNLTESVLNPNPNSDSQQSPEKVTKIKLMCSDVLFFHSVFKVEDLFSPFSNLKQLHIENCKLINLSGEHFRGLTTSKLESFSVRGNSQKLGLEILPGFFPQKVSFSLRSLDLIGLNVNEFPVGFLCQLTNLTSLNLTGNHLSDIRQLQLPPHSQNQEPRKNESSCEDRNQFLSLKSLDLSSNFLTSLPAQKLVRLKNLLVLRLENNKIDSVDPTAFQGLHSLQKLNLSSNNLVFLPQNVFESNSQLQELDLSFNILTFNSSSAAQNPDSDGHNDMTNPSPFNSLSRLIILNLSHNKISHISSSTFSGLSALKILDLSYNSISTPHSSFHQLSSLTYLNLAGNQLTTVTRSIFSSLIRLQRLSLDDNFIQEIQEDAFLNLSIHDLSLTQNKLRSVPVAIRRLPLRSLDLGANSLEQITPASFSSLTHLFGLRLINNQIREIPKDFCKHLRKLKILNLAQNNIQKIHNSAFSLCPDLKILRIDSNELNQIPPNFAGQLKNLLWLNASGNEMTGLDFGQLPSDLEYLDVSYNRMISLWGANTDFYSHFHPRRHDHANSHHNETRKNEMHSTNLKYLDASHNKLRLISPESIPIRLEILRLSHNQIGKVNSDTFTNSPNLRRIELHSNKLTSLHFSTFSFAVTAPEFVDISGRGQKNTNQRPLIQIFLAGNPFVCDCDMEFLFNQLRPNSWKLSTPMVISDAESILCHLPFSRTTSSKKLIEMKPQDFLCTYNLHCFALCHCCDYEACDCNMQCPEGCKCYHDDSWSQNVIDCASSNHSVIPPQIPMDSTEIYLDGNSIGELKSHGFIGRKNLKLLYLNNSMIERIHNKSFNGLQVLQVLHLEENLLSALHGYEFDHLIKLRELYLHNNGIRSISNSTFLPLKLLEILRLDGNQLVVYSLWQLSLNSHLTHVHLSGNPWNCHCHFLLQFYSWTTQNSKKIPDMSQLRCSWNNSKSKWSRNEMDGLALMDFNVTCATSSIFTWPIFAELLDLPIFGMVVAFVGVFLMCVALVVVVCSVIFCGFGRGGKGVEWWRWKRGQEESDGRISEYWMMYHCFCCGSVKKKEKGDDDDMRIIVYYVEDGDFVAKRILEEFGQRRKGYFEIELCALRVDPDNNDSTREKESGISSSSAADRLIFSPTFLHSTFSRPSFSPSHYNPGSSSSPTTRSTPSTGNKSSPSSIQSHKSILILRDPNQIQKINSHFLTFFSASVDTRIILWSDSDKFWNKFKTLVLELKEEQGTKSTGSIHHIKKTVTISRLCPFLPCSVMGNLHR